MTSTKATIQLTIEHYHDFNENETWLFRTNKDRSEIVDINGQITDEFYEFLKEHYEGEIYVALQHAFAYEILYIDDEYADIVDF